MASLVGHLCDGNPLVDDDQPKERDCRKGDQVSQAIGAGRIGDNETVEAALIIGRIWLEVENLYQQQACQTFKLFCARIGIQAVKPAYHIL